MPEYSNDATEWGIADKPYERSIAETDRVIRFDPETGDMLFYNHGWLTYSYERLPDRGEDWIMGEGRLRGGDQCVWYWPTGYPQYIVRNAKLADNLYRRHAAVFADDGWQVAGKSALFKHKFVRKRGRLTRNVQRDREARHVPQWHHLDFEDQDIKISFRELSPTSEASPAEHCLPALGRVKLVDPETGVASIFLDGSLRVRSADLIITRLTRKEGIDETPVKIVAQADIFYYPGNLPYRIEFSEHAPNSHYAVVAGLDAAGRVEHISKTKLKKRRYGRHGLGTVATQQETGAADEARLAAIVALLSPHPNQPARPARHQIEFEIPQMPVFPPAEILQKVANF